MSEKQARKGGGAKLSRSQTVTVRLDPQLRYMAELASRKQRRTVSSYIEWAIEESLKHILLHENGDSISVAGEMNHLWDVDESDRFAKLAINYPELLTHDEQVLWKLIRENGALWRGHYTGASKEWMWEVRESEFRFELLREHWGIFKAVAAGEREKSALPDWSCIEERGVYREDAADFDDDTPL